MYDECKLKQQRKLSTIEMTVLGLAWLRGPCTTYAIMKELSTSGSSYYKSRAGTAYSVAKRLTEFGLLAPSGEHIRATDDGIKLIREWMAPPIPNIDVAHSADLIRLRFFFLNVLDEADRIAFIDTSIKQLQALMPCYEELVEKNEEIGEYFGVLATVGVILETRARIEWLRLIKKWLIEPIPKEAGWARTVLKSIE